MDFITEKISLPVNEVSKTITFFTLLFKLIKIAAMMQQNGIVARAYIRYKKLIFPAIPGGGAMHILDRDFSSDTTHVEIRQGWLYLATITDLYPRKVVDWSMSNHNNTALVTQALVVAIKQKPK